MVSPCLAERAAVYPACGRGRDPGPSPAVLGRFGPLFRRCGGNLFGRPPASCSACGGRKEKQDKGRGSPWAPPASHTAPQCGSGQRVAGILAGLRNGVEIGIVISCLRSISPKPYCHKEKTGVRAGICLYLPAMRACSFPLYPLKNCAA